MSLLVVTPATLSLAIGESYQLTVLPNLSGVRWCCRPFSVASVTTSGRVTGLSAGTAVILAQKGNTTVEVLVTVPGGAPPPIPPDPPTAQLQVFSGATEDDVWELITSGTDPAPGDAFTTSSIDFGDGSPIVNYVGAPPLSIDHTWAAGSYTATLTVTAALGGTVQTTLDLVVPVGPTPPDPPPQDVAPSAAIAYVSGQYVSTPFVFSTANTLDVDGVIVSYTINYGDGTPVVPVSGPPPATLTHSYATPSSGYTVTLTVTDDDGLMGTATTTAVVQADPASAQPPIAKLARLTGTYVGDTYAFSTTGTADPDGTLVSWTFDPGNGHPQGASGAPPALLNAVYTVGGTVTATLTVVDNSGLFTQTTLQVTASTPPSGQPHARFDALRALPQHFSSYGLRTQAELNSLTAGGLATRYTYDAGEDAGKCLWPADKASIEIGQQLRPPIHQTSGVFLFTWDTKWGLEWRSVANGGNLQSGLTHKEFQIRTSQGATGDGAITMETRVVFSLSLPPTEVCSLNNRLYQSSGLPAGMTKGEPPTPPGLGAVTPNSTKIAPAIWGRFVEEVRLNQPPEAFVDWFTLTGATLAAGLYHMYSVWYMDSTRTVRVLFRIPVKLGTQTTNGITAFNFEHNTSTGVGPLIAPAPIWSRDWVTLKNYPLDGATPETAYPLIFQRPT